jgi:hypothetical protein
MSDEDFNNFVFPDEEVDTEVSENLETSEEIDNNEGEEEIEDDSSEDELEEEADDLESEEEESEEEFDEDDQDEDTDSEEEEESSDEEEDTSDDTDIAKELFAPLKANGQEYNIDNVDDARKLMSMGLNYNKKMQAIKPHLKVIRTLENQDLLDLDKINQLIDLTKGDKKAIAKLVKDSNIDPLDISTEDAAEYSPKSYTASDEEVAIDQVLSDIRETGTFGKLQSELESSKWDVHSKSVFAKDPSLLVTINDQIGSGIYDQIMQKVEMEQVLGKYKGMSTLDAYFQVGQQMHNANELVTQQKQAPATAPTKSKPKVDPKKLKQKKRVASQPRGKTKPASKQNFDYLSMTDEEFEKQFGNSF